MASNSNSAFRHWIPVIVWMSFIFLMSTGSFSSENTSSIIEPVLRFLLPGISVQELDTFHGVIRKCGHVAEYFILGILLFRAFRGGSAEPRLSLWAFYSLVVMVLYAAGDEFHQSFVASRTSSAIDVGFDAAGGVLSLIVSAVCYRRTR